MSELETRQQQFAQTFGLTLQQYKRLASSVTYEELITCLELLKAKKHKSGSRARMAESIRQWIDYGTSLKPLSMFEFRKAMPTWPIKIQIPT